MNTTRGHNPSYTNEEFTNEEFKDLIKRLAEAEAAFQANINGDVDVVLDPVNYAPVMLRQAQEALLRREKQLSQAEKIARIGSWSWDLASDSSTWSDELFRIFGLPPQPAPTPFGEFLARIQPEDRERVKRKIEIALEDLEPFSVEYRIRHADGGSRVIETHGEVILNPGGEPAQIIGTAQDITDKKLAEEELQTMFEELREAKEELRSQNEALISAQADLQRERQRYQDLFEFAPDGYLVTDMNGVIQEANQAAMSLLGARGKFVAGKPLVVFILPEERRYFHTMLRQIEKDERVRGWETRIQTRAGRFVPVNLIVAAERDQAGKAQAIRWQVHDITERVRAEKSLRESEERYRLVVESVKDYAIYTLDPDGNVTSWNAGAQAIKGYTTEEILGRHFSCFYLPEEIEKNIPEQALHKAQSDGQHSTEGWRLRKDGSRFWASVVVSPMLDKHHRLRGFSKVVRDITRRKQAAEALERQTTFVRLLQKIAVAANQATSVKQAVQLTLDVICPHFQWEVGHALIPTGDPPGQLVSLDTWYTSGSNRFEPLRKASQTLPVNPKASFLGQVFTTGEPVWIEDITRSANYQRLEAAQSGGLKTWLAFPIMAGERVAGVLEFYASQSRELDEPVLEVMAHIGTQLGRVFERSQAEAALRQSEARFRTIFNGSALGIELLDLEGRLLECNPALSAMLGYSNKELSRMSLFDFDRFVNDAEEQRLFNALRAGELDAYRLKKQLTRKDDAPVWADVLVTLVRDEQGRPQYIIGMLEDITERQKMETELDELNRRMILGREKDRLHLSRELHDGPVQDLYGLSFHLKSFADHLPEEVDRQPVEQLQATMYKVIDTLRAICGELRPPTLAPFGLAKAIRSHAASFKEAHPEIDVQLNLTPDGLELSEAVRLALFRIYQQAMVNVVRHAQARNVLVHFGFDEDQITLAVQDDGVGFSLPERWIKLARDGHLGLAGASERAISVGGQLLIDSAPGKGTLLRVVVPRSKNEHSPGDRK